MSPRPSPEHFADIHRRLQAPVSRFDCGKMCAPLNGGEPVCCSTDHAIPIMDRAEYRLLRQKSDLWRPFKPKEAIRAIEITSGYPEAHGAPVHFANVAPSILVGIVCFPIAAFVAARLDRWRMGR